MEPMGYDARAYREDKSKTMTYREDKSKTMTYREDKRHYQYVERTMM